MIWSGSLGLKLIFKMSYRAVLTETPTYGHNCELQGPAVSGKSVKEGLTPALLSSSVS